MSPISPRRAASPMLLGGAHAAAFLPLARELGFAGAKTFSGKLGAASAAKMCRSVIVKGLEALMLESLLTARQHGVDEAVLDSLQSLFPVGRLARHRALHDLARAHPRPAARRRDARSGAHGFRGRAFLAHEQRLRRLGGLGVASPRGRGASGPRTDARRIAVASARERVHADHRLSRALHHGAGAAPEVPRGAAGANQGLDASCAGAGAGQRRRDPRVDRDQPASPAARARRGPHPVLAARFGHGASRRRRIRVRWPGRAPATISSSAWSICIRRISSASASCRSRPACRSRIRYDELTRCVRELGFVGCNLNPDPSGGHWNCAAAHRPSLVSVLRKDGRARRAGHGPRFGVVQPQLPRHRRALHQCRHHRVHAVHPGRSVPRLSRHCASSFRTAAARCRITGAAIAALRTC